jgi:uncharacterized membrane protein
MVIYLRTRKAYTILVLTILATGIYANIRCWQPPSSLVERDIKYVFTEGQRIISGENPYSRILSGDMANNQKYPTYLPGFYELAALTQLLGLRDFESWVSAWRWIFLIFNIGIFLVLFFALDPKHYPWLALGAAGFWLLNRWTLEVTLIAQIEFPAIFFLVISLIKFRNNPNLAAYYLGISLAIKEIAVFIVPLYLIWTWIAAPSNSPNRIRQLLATAIRIALIPAIVSLPFLFWNPEGFVKSIIFSFTRNSSLDFDVPSAGEVLGFHLPITHFGLNRELLRLPMLVLLGLSYIATLRCEIGLHLSALLVIAIFVDFNPVLTWQYTAWIVPLIPLVARDFIGSRQRGHEYQWDDQS